MEREIILNEEFEIYAEIGEDGRIYSDFLFGGDLGENLQLLKGIEVRIEFFTLISASGGNPEIGLSFPNLDSAKRFVYRYLDSDK